ncbi:hypothetical protein QMK33_19980 [Hymenobacter sp. H14-R3]|uniref:hypothetical protein n=1 Tax=Hymenobacter sp. H14-R3 TaxID=3046308 RepID=UPI0024BB8D31|nr:hypothetical protein [Hymenobacter sp. H14-R3]MDJ0367434.1 hypothetical protein [Hymenobacter sp. H14-R3]
MPSSKLHAVDLTYLGIIEPNNGRMLWDVELRIKDQLVTEKYLGSWPTVTIGNHNESESPDGRFFFIPTESGGVVIDAEQDFKPNHISCKGQGASSFIGNFYDDNWLIIVHRNEVILFDLLTLQQHSLDFPSVSVWWAVSVDDQHLRITYREPGGKEDKEMVVSKQTGK